MPGAWDGFEIAVRAVLGQRLAAIGANPELSAWYGVWKPLTTPREGLTHLFPRPAVLADADLSTQAFEAKRRRHFASWHVPRVPGS